jgi:hypothetical protein
MQQGNWIDTTGITTIVGDSTFQLITGDELIFRQH